MSFICTKDCFIYRISQKISDTLWVMLENGWKCFLNCVLRFDSNVLNFNALDDVYTVLLKNNRIFCLLLGNIIGNCN